MTDREIMQTALVTLKNCLPVNYCYNNFGEASPMYKKDGLSVEKINESIKSLEAALAQPEQEPKLSDAGADTNIPLWGLEPKGEGLVVLHQPEQEPVAWVIQRTLIEGGAVDGVWTCDSDEDGAIPVYTAPPRKPWVRMTQADTEQLADQVGMSIDKYGLAMDKEDPSVMGVDIFGFAALVDAKLKELNG